MCVLLSRPEAAVSSPVLRVGDRGEPGSHASPHPPPTRSSGPPAALGFAPREPGELPALTAPPVASPGHRWETGSQRVGVGLTRLGSASPTPRVHAPLPHTVLRADHMAPPQCRLLWASVSPADSTESSPAQLSGLGASPWPSRVWSPHERRSGGAALTGRGRAGALGEPDVRGGSERSAWEPGRARGRSWRWREPPTPPRLHQGGCWQARASVAEC